MTELLAGQMLTEPRIDAKFESLGEMLCTQIVSAFKEHQVGTSGKELSDPTLFAENQLRRIELLEQQVLMWRADQVAFETWLESKLESFRLILRSQLLTALKEPKAEIPGKTGMEFGVGDFEISKQYCTNLVPVGGHLQEIDEDQHSRQLAVDGRETMRRLLASNDTAEDHEKHEFVAESIVEKIKDRLHGSKLSLKTDIIVLKPLVFSSGPWFDFHRWPACWKFSGRAYFDYLRFKFKVLDNPIVDTVVRDVKGKKSRSNFDAVDQNSLPTLGKTRSLAGHSIAYTVGILVDEAKWEFLDDLKARSPN